MQNSGTKLVLVLVGMALLLGVVSWWYRYETARRATQFWGPEASRLIAESEGFEVWSGSGTSAGVLLSKQSNLLFKVQDLSSARGQAHLRHAFMTDGNYVWSQLLEPAATPWKWWLRFHEGKQEAWVVLSEDFQAIGKRDQASDSIVGFSCQPMAASLQPYFEALGLLEKMPEAASTQAE